ncbi:MAG: tail fiber domain-containing protein [Rhizobacter sp.]|nr:tail fiber domain-containing protein [Ferruginibacter sp.]
MNKIILSLVLLVITRSVGFSQSVGIGTTTPDASAVLELKTTTKGFLPPRMTGSERGLIPSPKIGLLVYQTDGAAGLYVYNGASWAPVTGAAGTLGEWSLTGNSGTNPASNFIGTIDNQPLRFRASNIPAGEINPTTGNTVFGMNSLPVNSTGGQNTAVGYNSLNKNTSGADNTAMGIGALFSNTIGKENTALGKTTLVQNINGNNNLAMGAEALNQNVSGSANIALGSRTSYSNIDGTNIIAIGDSALFNNTGSYNIGIGTKALFANSTGVSNTALGSQSLSNNSTGSQNTAVGRIALFANTTGVQNTAIGNQASRYNQTGSANTALGFQSLFLNVANSNNTAVGNGSLAVSTADDNTAVGHSTLNDNTTGISNTAVGKDALATNTTGSYNTAIGYRANTWGANFTNATAIGAKAQAGCSDCVVLGAVNGYNGATNSSKVGIGITNPQKTLHVNPNGAGGILIGNDMTTGGYTGMQMGISQASGGYGYIQSVKAAWPSTTYGDLVFNLSGGNVGVRKATPLTPLHIKQSTDYDGLGGLRLERKENGNYWDIDVTYANGLDLWYNGVNKVRFSNIDGDIWTSSDLRLKKDIQNFETALPKLMKLEAKSYHYKDNDDAAPLSYGFIAQDVEKIFPGAVSSTGKDGMKAVAYQKINMLAIKSIQEQQVIIEAQQTAIQLLQQQNVLMLETIEKLQKTVEGIKEAK